MEMCYDGALVMPSSYAVMDNEEMTYLEGGVSYSKTSTGYKITLSVRECGDLAALAAGECISLATVSAVLGLSGVGTPEAIVCAVLSGVAGICSSYMWICSNHRGATMYAFMYKRVYLGCTPPVIRW